jgi:hypothetical protein
VPLIVALTAFAPAPLNAQSPRSQLQLAFGANGLERIVYHGETLEDVAQWPKDAFHIWHMKAFDQAGHALTSGQYGWGENHDSRTWNAAAQTWIYGFKWGTIRVQYKQQGDALNIVVTESNRADSGIAFDGSTIYPLALHLPRLPSGFAGPGDAQILGNINQPGVVTADFGSAEAVLATRTEDLPLYTGFQPEGHSFVYSPIISRTAPDGFAHPSPAHPIRPGQTITYTVSLHFAASGTLPEQVASDAYKAWAAHWPPTLHWADHRIIGTVFLASSAQGDKTRPAGFPANPRRYFTSANVDVRSPEGLKHFQSRVLRQAVEVTENLKRLHAQGAITWDIEGEEFPQDTSYACAPDEIAQLSPEMESIVTDKASPYAGMKLDDAYFKIIHDAGFRVGVCIRPQHFTLAADGTARQVSLPDEQVPAELIRKMKFARDRWGATIFYLDSTVEADGSTLPASVLEQAAAAVPDSLLIPEESSPRMYRSMAPFATFLFHGDLGTPAWIRALYPHAFSANLINDVAPEKITDHRAALIDSVRNGDILMVLSGYWQANDPAVVDLYREAAPATK